MDAAAKEYYNEKTLAQACDYYGINPETAKLIRDNNNLIFDCGDKILRLSYSGIRTKQEVAAELDWLEDLGKRELSVVKIIRSKHQNLCEATEGPNYFTAVLFEKIIAQRIEAKDWKAKHFKKLGEITGQLHKAALDYNASKGISHKHWDQIMEFDCYQYLPEDDRKLKQLHNDIVRNLREIPITQENYGLTHYDIHHGNYLYDKQGNFVLFDFEMAALSWFVNDVATVLFYALHFPRKEQTSAAFEEFFMENFWTGYEKWHHIDETERRLIPEFLLYRDLMVYGFLTKISKDSTGLNKAQEAYTQLLSDSIAERSAKRSTKRPGKRPTK